MDNIKTYYADGREQGKSYDWWNQDQPHQMVHGLVTYLDQNQKWRELNYTRGLQLYGNLMASASMQSGFMLYSDLIRNSGLGLQNRMAYNVVKSCTDTVVSKITKSKIKATFLTSAGDWEEQQKAKNLERFVQGSFYSGKLYDVYPRVLTDACIGGTGVMKVFADGTDIRYERVIPVEMFVDEVDGFYCDPRNLYQRKRVDRTTVAAMWPEYAGQIYQCAGAPQMTSTATVDTVFVTEAWRLPQGKDKGCHYIGIENCTFVCEPYKRTAFPFIFIRWSEFPTGFWGTSLADELVALQLEINRLLYFIQESQRIMASPKLLVQNGSNVVTSHLNNQIGAIYKYSGVKPEVIAPQPVHPDIYQHLETLYRKAYEIVGVSQLTANSTKPSGLNSGKALREYSDIGSERFAALINRNEQFFIQCAEQTIECAKEISASNPGFTVKAHSKEDGVEQLKWSEVTLGEERYVMQIFPTNALSDTPAGKLEDVQELVQSGLMPASYALDLLDFPDLKEATEDMNAGIKAVQKAIYKMVQRGEYTQPEPLDNLQLNVQMGSRLYVRMRNQGVPDDRLQLIRDFVTQSQALIPPAPAAPAPAPGQNPQSSQG